MEITRICEWCGKEFTAQTVVTKYCCHRCANLAYKRRKRQECIQLTNRNSEKALVDKAENEVPLVMTTALAAKYLGVHISTIYRYLEKGTIKGLQLPGKTLIRKTDIDELFDNASRYITKVRPEKEEEQGYITVKTVSERYSISPSGAYKILKENNIPYKKLRGKDYYSLVPVTRLFNKKHRERESYPDLTEWYTSKDIQEKYGMTYTAVSCFVHTHGIPRKRIGNLHLYSKIHVDAIKDVKLTASDGYYTVQECMKAYNFTRDQVYHTLRYYKIPRTNFGRYVKFRKEDFDKHFIKPDEIVE